MSTSTGAERERTEPAAATGCGARVVAAPGLVLGLQLTPVVGILGALAVYWSRGWQDGLFLLGLLLLTGSIGVYRLLRARLVARVAQQLMLRGLRASRARASAERDVDGLLRLARMR